MNLPELSDFCEKYLETWNKRSTLRTLDRYRMTKNDLSKSDIYPRDKQALCTHPEIIARGEAFIQKLLTHSAYQTMAEVAGIEVLVVTDICSKLATCSFPVEISRPIRQVALTIATDESYHAFVAREFLEDLENMSNIPQSQAAETKLDKIPLIVAIDQFKKSVPQELSGISELISLCFAENFLTEDLYGLTKDQNKDEVFQIIIREHLMDEGRHQLFFQKLLRYLWTQLDISSKKIISTYLPKFLDQFLMDLYSMEARDKSVLTSIGIIGNEAELILEEVYDKTLSNWPGYKGGLAHAASTYKLLETSGLLDDPFTFQKLKEAQWVP
ncbi:MAG: hypothetical protein ACI93R_003183 [Flavobacteriales bacterium]|jgi:hypothetical protein